MGNPLRACLPWACFMLGLLVVAGPFAVQTQAERVTFVPLGDLGGTSSFGRSSRALGISGDGRVVVGDSFSSAGIGLTKGVEAFLWRPEKRMRGLGGLSTDHFFSTAWDVSLDGQVIVGESQTNKGRRAFRWTAEGGMSSLGVLPRHDRSVAYGASNDGRVVVGVSSSPGRKEAVRWTADRGLERLSGLPGQSTASAALAVSGSGSVVVGRVEEDGRTLAFRWTADDGLQHLGTGPGGRGTSGAYGVSHDGSVVVGQLLSARGLEAFRWTNESGPVGLGDLEGGELRSMAFAVSADGRTVVGQGETAAGPEAFVWDARRGMRSLQALVQGQESAHGWQLRQARDICDDGTVVVGIGRNAKGETAAWLVRREMKPGS